MAEEEHGELSRIAHGALLIAGGSGSPYEMNPLTATR